LPDAKKKLVVWTLLDTSLGVAEITHLKKDHIDLPIASWSTIKTRVGVE
jgi:hypothetical protein